MKEETAVKFHSSFIMPAIRQETLAIDRPNVGKVDAK